jgi:hypothetical protein
MKTTRRLLVAGIILGALLTLSPMFALLDSFIGTIQILHTLGSPDPSNLQTVRAIIGTILVSGLASIFFCAFGIIILTLSLILYFRARRVSPSPLPTTPAP